MENSSDLSFALQLQGASVGVPSFSWPHRITYRSEIVFFVAPTESLLKFDSTSRVSIPVPLRGVQVST